MIYRNNVFIYFILYLCYTDILFSGDMADVDRPITQVAIVADSTKCPPGFTLVILFDLQKMFFFKIGVTQYIEFLELSRSLVYTH